MAALGSISSGKDAAGFGVDSSNRRKLRQRRADDDPLDQRRWQHEHPEVVVDNGVCATATLVQVHSARKHGVLLEAVAERSDHSAAALIFVCDEETGARIEDAARIRRVESRLHVHHVPRWRTRQPN